MENYPQPSSKKVPVAYSRFKNQRKAPLRKAEVPFNKKFFKRFRSILVFIGNSHTPQDSVPSTCLALGCWVLEYWIMRYWALSPEVLDPGTWRILIYVDDILLISKDESFFTKIIKHLKNKFDVKDIGDLKLFLGVEICRTPITIKLCQQR